MSLDICRSSNCNGCVYVLFHCRYSNCCDFEKYANWLNLSKLNIIGSWSDLATLNKIIYTKSYIESNIFKLLKDGVK